MTGLLGILAFILAALLILVATFYLQERSNLQQANADLERFDGISDLEKHKKDVDTKLQRARKILPKFQSLAQMEEHRQQLSANIEEFQSADSQWQERLQSHQSSLNDLQSQMQGVEETLEMQSFGFYQPRYGFDDSQHYTNKLKSIREGQKGMVKSETATHCPQEWIVEGSAAKGRKMIKEHAKLMLRAFNGECDAAVDKAKYNNVNNLENRINRSFEAINKLGKSEQLWMTQDYLNLKL